MKMLKKRLENASCEADVHWVDGLRKELGLDKIAEPWYDRVKQILKMRGPELGRMSRDALDSHFDALAGWHLYLKDTLGRARALKKLGEPEVNGEIYRGMSEVKGGSIEERKSVVLWNNESLNEKFQKLIQLEALIEQVDSTVWGVESKMKSIENYITKKRFEDYRTKT
jgi:hypothetical protein